VRQPAASLPRYPELPADPNVPLHPASLDSGADAMSLLALLRRIQWADHDGWETCPECGGHSGEGLTSPNQVAGHLAGCELKAAIDRLESEKAPEQK